MIKLIWRRWPGATIWVADAPYGYAKGSIYMIHNHERKPFTRPRYLVTFEPGISIKLGWSQTFEAAQVLAEQHVNSPQVEIDVAEVTARCQQRVAFHNLRKSLTSRD
jgi:hypothetical protein